MSDYLGGLAGGALIADTILALDTARWVASLGHQRHLAVESAMLRASLDAIAVQYNSLVDETNRRGEVIGQLEQEAIARERRIAELEQAVRKRDNRIEKLNRDVEALITNANGVRDRLDVAKAASDPYHDQEEMRLIRQILGIHWRN